MKNEHLTLPPSRAFMDDITILVPSKIAADDLLQRYYYLSYGPEWRLSQRKVEAYRFKIGGDTIPTVREKPVESLGRLYSIPLTDRHRGTKV